MTFNIDLKHTLFPIFLTQILLPLFSFLSFFLLFVRTAQIVVERINPVTFEDLTSLFRQITDFKEMTLRNNETDELNEDS